MTAMTDKTAVTIEIERRLAEHLSATDVRVVNESELHAGHRNSPGTGDSHFRVYVMSPMFGGQSRLARQRLVHMALAPLMGKPIHALSIEARAPGEIRT